MRAAFHKARVITSAGGACSRGSACLECRGVLACIRARTLLLVLVDSSAFACRKGAMHYRNRRRNRRRTRLQRGTLSLRPRPPPCQQGWGLDNGWGDLPAHLWPPSPQVLSAEAPELPRTQPAGVMGREGRTTRHHITRLPLEACRWTRIGRRSSNPAPVHWVVYNPHISRLVLTRICTRVRVWSRF